MSNKTNHRRPKNKPKVDRRFDSELYRNGYARSDGKSRCSDGSLVNSDGVDETQNMSRVGRTGYLDKSLHGRKCEVTHLADRSIGASIGNDFCNGHRGMARAIKGAKKFVRSRIRFHENTATRRLSQLLDE